MQTGKIFILLLVVFLNLKAPAQEAEKKFDFNGYLSTMQSAMFESFSDPFINDNLLHNRLNFKGYISADLTFAAELRNRLFTGDMVKTGSYYSGLISSDPGCIDMSWNIVNKTSILLNSKIDRLWLDYSRDKFQITIGRQRINWGQTFVWNPNDIFNAYSFFDFDYIERPGSDAVRIQVFPSYSSVAELALKIDNDNDVTAAGLFRFNALGYDIQFLAGLVNSEDIVIGTGWSGAVGSVSFRGEGSWFQPLEKLPGTMGDIIMTAGLDKIFRNSSMVQFQFMYCNNPLEMSSFNSLYSADLSAKDLAFSEFSAFGQFTLSVNPLLNISLSAMWFPDLEGFFAGPSADYSLAGNVDFSFILQHFNIVADGGRHRMNLGFLRLKYSF